MSLETGTRRQGGAFWNSGRLRGIALQGLLLLGLAALFYDLALNTAANMASRHIVSGFDFLWRRAGFEVSFMGAILAGAAASAAGGGLGESVLTGTGASAPSDHCRQ